MANPDSRLKKPKRATGPRTAKGKAISSKNSTKHGCCSNKLILPGESQEEYDQLLRGWLDDYEPSTHEAMCLVREACAGQWFLIRNRGRYNEAEQRLCEEQPDALDWTDEQHQLIERFRRYMTQAERQFNRAFSMLEQLRRSRFQESMTRIRAEERATELELKRADNATANCAKVEKIALREQAQQDRQKTRESAKNAKSEAPTNAAGKLFQGQNSTKKRQKIHCLEQWVEVTVEDGQTITTLYPSNQRLIERGKQMWPAPDYVYRRVNFPNGVPAEYDWVGVNENRQQYGGCALQRMTPDTWLETIKREGPEVLREGYQSSTVPNHIGPTGVGNLPRPQERGGCECPVCQQNQQALDRQEMESATGQKEPEAA
jgi:hypothetical protein